MTDDIEYLNFIDKLLNTKLSCGKSVIELTRYNDIVLWSFADIEFYYFIDRLKNINPNIRSNHNSLFFTVHKYAESFFDRRINTLVKFIIKFYEKKNNFQNENIKPLKIFVTAQDLEWRDISDYEINRIIKSDAYFHSIIKKLIAKNNYEILAIYPIAPTIRSLKIYVDKMKNWCISQKPFNLYWNRNIGDEESKASAYFKECMGIIKNDKSFKDICKYKEKNLHDEIISELEIFFNLSFPRYFKFVEMAKQMIDIENPDLLLIVNEYGTFERALVVAGRQKKVPTLAFQHGIITPTSRGYIYNKEYAEKIVLPDKTAVFGKYHYDLLVNNSIYEPDKVVITGQPRYDIFFHANRIYQKENFLERYKINPHHKLVLWTTQCHGLSDMENMENFMVVFRTMQNLKDVTLIIKQHIGEGLRYTKMIEDCKKQYNISTVMTPKNSDTYEQLYLCDLMITKNSTTGMEAIALNKPVIVLNLSGEQDMVDYVEQGVALGVYKTEDLQPSIEILLNDDSVLAKNRERFIERYMYKVDGKATERVVNLIEQMVHK